VWLAPRLFMLVVVLAFALQSYVTQTHIHGVVPGFGSAANTSATKSHAPAKAPLDNSQGDCPLCQAVIHSGVFLAATTPLLSLPFAWVKTVTLAVSARATYGIAAHDWQSRAPPQT